MLRNLAAVYPALLEKSQGYGVPATYSLVGVAYNTALVKTPPESWADLWKPELKGKVGIARTSSNLGLATLAIAAKTFGGSEDNLDPGWERLKMLEAKAARSPATLTQMLEREEIAIAPLWNNNTAAAAEKGLPIRFAMPKPGAIAIISFFSAIANTRHPDLVNEWLDGILSPAYQARAAGAPYYFGPTVRGVTVPEAARPYTPSTPEEVLALQTIDWTKIVPVRGQLVERFDRTFRDVTEPQGEDHDLPSRPPHSLDGRRRVPRPRRLAIRRRGAGSQGTDHRQLRRGAAGAASMACPPHGGERTPASRSGSCRARARTSWPRSRRRRAIRLTTPCRTASRRISSASARATSRR